MNINKHFEKSVDSTEKNFVNFVKLNTDDLTDKDLEDINFLAQRVAQNMFYYTDNINTAKTDYITLIGMLIKKGVLFEEFKDLIPNKNYFNE